MTTKLKSQKVYSRFNRQRVKTPVGDGKQKAKQSFKNECDINQILAKYQKTGAITHFNKHVPNYGFATSDDFADSMRIITQANEMFAELPSSIRTKFDNKPEDFLRFVQNPENASEMADLGLTKGKSESPPEDAPAASGGDPKPAAAPPEDPPTG